MIYLASPFAHADPLVKKTRFMLAKQVLATLLIQGKHAFSPIVHCYDIAEEYSLPKEHEWWMELDIDFLRRFDELYVLTIPGWRESKGVGIEIEVALTLNLPIKYINENGEKVYV